MPTAPPAEAACPRCPGTLRQSDRSKKIWHCNACEGRAVGFAALAQEFPHWWLHRLQLLAHQDRKEKKLNCPFCRKPMGLATTHFGWGYPPLDVCSRCWLAWFDPQELGTSRARVAEEEGKIWQAPKDDEGWLEGSWKWLFYILGFPVEREVNLQRRVPWVTWGLVALITLVTLLSLGNLPQVVQQWGFVPAEPWRYGGLTLLTSFFLHGGFLHLLGNLYFLLVFGDNVEDYLGARRFVLLLLASALTGDLLHMALDPASSRPAIGASGGISGVLLFYALQFPRSRLLLWFRLVPLYPLFLPAIWVIGFWVLWEVFGVLAQLQGMSNVSSLAHLGGAAAGALLWTRWRRIYPWLTRQA